MVSTNASGRPPIAATSLTLTASALSSWIETFGSEASAPRSLALSPGDGPPKPVVAMVAGYAIGGGNVLAILLAQLGRGVEVVVRVDPDSTGRSSKQAKTMLDPAPRMVIDPLLGFCAAGRTAKDARIVHDLYAHTIAIASCETGRARRGEPSP